MYLPVTMPPLAARFDRRAALGRTREPRPLTRLWLRFTALLGFAGAGFHVYGRRAQHGRLAQLAAEPARTARPIPAPPSFTGLALAGLAALGLLEDHPDD